MTHSKQKGTYVGHSREFSAADALQDAVNQAVGEQGMADAMIEFEVVRVHGRAGGIAGFRDLWVEISTQGAGKGKDPDRDEPKYTTMAVGEEGGEADKPVTTLAIGEEGGGGEDKPMTTLAVGEEGGDDHKVTTLALGEEGG